MKTTKIQVYKVTLLGSDGKLHSWMYNSLPYSRIYTLGKGTMPRKGCGPLAAFSSLREAFNFVCCYSSKYKIINRYCRILLCEAVVSEETQLYIPHKTFYEILPLGTVLCRYIKPLKEVPYEL